MGPCVDVTPGSPATDAKSNAQSSPAPLPLGHGDGSTNELKCSLLLEQYGSPEVEQGRREELPAAQSAPRACEGDGSDGASASALC